MSEKRDLSDNSIINSSSIAINTSRSINHNNDYFNDIIRPATLISLYNLGFNLVPLSENHKPVVDWSSVYGNSDYWKIENFDNQATYSKFTNVASTLGKTHIKDIENRDLYLQVLDIDSEYILDILSKRLSQIIDDSNDVAKPIIQEFLKSIGITDVSHYDDLTILEICKKNTFVTKTKKPYGYHIWWLSHMQNESIHTKDCKNGFEFEIKTKKELCTLPPSSHRDDKNFRYQAVGRKDKIIENNFLYTLFIRVFSNCLENNKQNQENNNSVIKNSDIKQQKNTFFNDLSNQTIQKSVECLLPYYINGSRNDFVLSFSGTAFHSKISEESASSIIEGICEKTCDNEKQNRLVTLYSTYKKGIENKAVTGAPSLVEVIGRTKGHDQTVGKGIIDTLKKLWQQDILNKYDIHDIEKEKDKPPELSIAQAIRAQNGFVQVKGTIVGRSSVYNFIKSVTWICSVCKSESKIELAIPSFKSPYKNERNCRTCIEESNLKYTAIANFEYISVVDVELQDLDEHNEIERLSVKIFGKDTYDVIAGELASIVGHLHVIRKNDNPRNKLETVLFAGSIFYTKRQELVLTDEDKKHIENWKQQQLQHNKNPIDKLASLFAPELIELDNVKIGMLLVCASAGLRNVNGMFPKRSRLNVLLIGDPGLAKTALLEKTVKLIPNSQFTGGQSSTGLSLTAHVHNDENGSYALRFGPVVLAKDSICAINELGQLPFEQHKHLLDCMEENGFPIAKHGFSTFVEAHPSIIASANPINNKWQNGESISFSEFPTLLQIIQRFDLIFIFRENRDVIYLERYVDERKRIADNYKKGIYEKDEEFLKKYLLYARTFKPELNYEASSILKQFFISMGASGISGLPRKLESLMRITISIAKLKLKNNADAEDANETILLYNDILKDFNQVVTISKNPRDLSFDMIRKIIKEYNGHPIFLTTAAAEACNRDPNVKYYLLGKDFQDNNHKDITENLKLNKSYHLKEVLSLLRNDERIQIVKEKPVEVRWKTESEIGKDKGAHRSLSSTSQYNNHHRLNKSEITDTANNISNHVSQECDECDECDAIKNENKNLFDSGQEILELGVNADSDSNTIKANDNSVFDKSINDTLTNMDNKQITVIGHQNTDENSVNSEVKSCVNTRIHPSVKCV